MVYETCVCKNEKRENICDACSLGNNLGEWQCLHTSPSLLCHWLTWGKPNSLSARQIWDDYIPFSQTLSLRPPLAPAVFCNRRSANRSRPPSPLSSFSLSLNFSPRKTPFFRTVVCAQQHQETSISAAPRNWWCHYIPTKYNNEGNQRKLHVFQKANNLIAGCDDSLTCSPSPPDRLGRVAIRRWSTAPCSKKNKTKLKACFPPRSYCLWVQGTLLALRRQVCHLGITVRVGWNQCGRFEWRRALPALTGIHFQDRKKGKEKKTIFGKGFSPDVSQKQAGVGVGPGGRRHGNKVLPADSSCFLCCRMM